MCSSVLIEKPGSQEGSEETSRKCDFTRSWGYENPLESLDMYTVLILRQSNQCLLCAPLESAFVDLFIIVWQVDMKACHSKPDGNN